MHCALPVDRANVSLFIFSASCVFFVWSCRSITGTFGPIYLNIMLPPFNALWIGRRGRHIHRSRKVKPDTTTASDMFTRNCYLDRYFTTFTLFIRQCRKSSPPERTRRTVGGMVNQLRNVPKTRTCERQLVVTRKPAETPKAEIRNCRTKGIHAHVCVPHLQHTLPPSQDSSQ